VGDCERRDTKQIQQMSACTSPTPSSAKEIPLPLCLSYDKFINEYDEEGVKTYVSVQCVLRRVRLGLNPYGLRLADSYFRVGSEEPEKKELLDPLIEQYKEQLSETPITRVRTHDFVEMLFTIKAIKKMAADPECFFDVPSILERTKGEMEGDEGSWEWISVHTE